MTRQTDRGVIYRWGDLLPNQLRLIYSYAMIRTPLTHPPIYNDTDGSLDRQLNQLSNQPVL